jgi:MtrB/PioB family decaheme-associated outer membrane protein
MKRIDTARVIMPLLIAMTLAGLAPGGDARAQTSLGPVSVAGSAEVGGFVEPVPDTTVAKYREYSDRAQQIIAPELSLIGLDKNDDRAFADFHSYNLGQTNQMYNLHAGVYGLVEIQAQWLEIPHYLSDDVGALPFTQDGGSFTLTSHPAPPTAGQPAGQNVGTWVDQTAHPVALSLLEGVANLHVRFTPNPDWAYTAYFNFQNPSANYGAFGTMFGPSPGSYNVAQVSQPIEYDIYNYGVGADYSKDWWTVGFKYDGSFFKNEDSVLTWSNPDVWSELAPSGACVSSATYSPSGGTGPCAGRMQLYPDNESQTFTVDGGAHLPLNTQAMASVSYGWWLQNQGFIPFTDNTALKAQSLPQSSLGGDVQPFFANATLVSKPLEALELRGTYSYYDYSNEDPAIKFKDVTSLNDISTKFTATAFPFSFSQQNIEMTASYNLTPTLAARMVGRIDTDHNRGMMVLQQDQTSYGPVLDWTPSDWLQFQGSYQHAYRDSPDYNNNRATLVAQNAANTELDEMRRFDEATVEVNQFNLSGSVRPFEASEDAWLSSLSIYASMGYDDYNYPASDIGLQHWSDYVPSVGINYEPSDDLKIFADYSWQATDWDMISMQRQPHAPNPIEAACPASPDAQTPQNCPAQVWTGFGRDQGSSVDVGIEVAVPALNVEGTSILRNKSKLSVNYTYSVSTSLSHANGDGALGPATSYPNVSTQFQELIVQYEYPFASRMSLKVGYYFNHFGESDFAYDNLTQWMGSASPDSTFLGSTTWTPYSANAAYLALHFKF